MKFYTKKQKAMKLLCIIEIHYYYLFFNYMQLVFYC